MSYIHDRRDDSQDGKERKTIWMKKRIFCFFSFLDQLKFNVTGQRDVHTHRYEKKKKIVLSMIDRKKLIENDKQNDCNGNTEKNTG